jgi:hypothetical protein
MTIRTQDIVDRPGNFTVSRRYRADDRRAQLRACENALVTTAIFVILALVAVGLVVDALLRLRKWLQRPPPRSDTPPSD